MDAQGIAKEFQEQLELGPAEGEDFFRIKVTGAPDPRGYERSRWLNIEPDLLRVVIEALEDHKEYTYQVLVDGKPETHYKHDSMSDAHDEAFHIREQIPTGSVVQVRRSDGITTNIN